MALIANTLVSDLLGTISGYTADAPLTQSQLAIVLQNVGASLGVSLTVGQTTAPTLPTTTPPVHVDMANAQWGADKL